MPKPDQFNPVAKNIIFVTISHFLLKLVSAFISIVIARYLGVRDLGYYATAIGFSSLAGILTNAGLRDILIKNISIKRENIKEYISSAIFIQFVLSAVVYLVMLLITNFLSYEPVVIKLIYIAGASAFLSDITEFLFAYYYGIQRMEKIAVFRFIYSISIISLICTVIYFKKGLITIALANLAVAISVTVLLLFSIIKENGFKVKKALFSVILKESFPFGLNIIFNIAYTRIGIVLLSLFAGAVTVGLYDSSYKVITMLGIVPNIILTAIYPVLFSLGISAGQDYRKIFNLALRSLSFIGFPVGTFLFMYSTEISVLIYGKSFTEAGTILKILAFIFTCQCISYPLSDALTTNNKQTVRTRITGIAFIITLTGNLFFIPLKGVLATAFVALLVEIFLVFVLIYYVKNLVFEIKIFDLISKQVISSLVMSIGLYFLSVNQLNLLSAFSFGTISYLLVWSLFNIGFFRKIF